MFILVIIHSVNVHTSNSAIHTSNNTIHTSNDTLLLRQPSACQVGKVPCRMTEMTFPRECVPRDTYGYPDLQATAEWDYFSSAHFSILSGYEIWVYGSRFMVQG